MSKKCIYFSSLFYNYMVIGAVAISFRCVFLRAIECFLLWKNISKFATATRVKLFMTMTPLSMSPDVTCHRLRHHNCFSSSIQFELIYFISIWASHNLPKILLFSVSEKETNFSITPRSSNFRVIRTNFWGIRIFRKFTVYRLKGSGTLHCMNVSSLSPVICSAQFLTWSIQKISRNTTKSTMWLCAQRRLRSAWASTQSD